MNRELKTVSTFELVNYLTKSDLNESMLSSIYKSLDNIDKLLSAAGKITIDIENDISIEEASIILDDLSWEEGIGQSAYEYLAAMEGTIENLLELVLEYMPQEKFDDIKNKELVAKLKGTNIKDV